MSELLNILYNIENAFGVRVCVHDLSGITLVNKNLELPLEWKTHGGLYCTVAKDYGTVPKCMDQKEEALFTLKQSGLTPFYRICRMGVCEYLQPVIHEDKLIAVIFASGVIQEQKTEARNTLITEMQKIEFDCPELLQAYDEYAGMATINKNQLKVIAEFIDSYIRQAAKLESMLTNLPEDPIDMHPVEPIRVRNIGVASIIISYIEENYTRQLSLAALSKRFFISEGHLNRLVRQTVGMGAIAYIKQLRIQKAEKLLIYTNKSVREISEQCGYKDMNYFCRAFKQCRLVTPTEYREQNLKFYQAIDNKP